MCRKSIGIVLRRTKWKRSVSYGGMTCALDFDLEDLGLCLVSVYFLNSRTFLGILIKCFKLTLIGWVGFMQQIELVRFRLLRFNLLFCH